MYFSDATRSTHPQESRLRAKVRHLDLPHAVLVVVPEHARAEPVRLALQLRAEGLGWKPYGGGCAL